MTAVLIIILLNAVILIAITYGFKYVLTMSKNNTIIQSKDNIIIQNYKINYQ